jgi:hypothetical protein
MSHHAASMMIFTAPYLQDDFGFRSVVKNIPSDPMSLFVYALLALFVGWIIWGSRKKGTPSSGTKP